MNTETTLTTGVITKTRGGYSDGRVLLQPLAKGSYLRVVGLDRFGPASVQLVADGMVVASAWIARRQTRTAAQRRALADGWGLTPE